MWDTYKMWRMTRLLKKGQFEWAHTEFQPIDGESPEEESERIVNQLLEASLRSSEPDVIVTQLAVEYIKRYGKSANSNLSMVEWDEPQKQLAVAKSIIFNCKESGFLEYTNDLNGEGRENPYHAYITLKGKKFATIALVSNQNLHHTEKPLHTSGTM